MAPPFLVKLQSDPRVIAFCRAHGVRAIRLFGSALRADFTDESDVDVLLEFAASADPDLFELGGMQQELTEILGRTVDLKTPEMFSAHNLQRVVAQSSLAYAA